MSDTARLNLEDHDNPALTLPAMTAPAMTPEERRILRAMTPAQRLAAAEDMYRAARTIKAAALRRQHPDWGEERIRREVRDIFLHGRS